MDPHIKQINKRTTRLLHRGLGFSSSDATMALIYIYLCIES